MILLMTPVHLEDEAMPPRCWFLFLSQQFLRGCIGKVADVKCLPMKQLPGFWYLTVRTRVMLVASSRMSGFTIRTATIDDSSPHTKGMRELSLWNAVRNIYSCVASDMKKAVNLDSISLHSVRLRTLEGATCYYNLMFRRQLLVHIT